MSGASVAAAGSGPAALPEGGRVDFTRLREQRRQRLLAAMADHGLDALVLGRPADIAYASGARQLWTAGARPFSPGCVVLGATGAIHLLSTWDEGVPAEIAHESLYGLSWNPARLLANLRAIPDTAGLRRVGTDGWSPGSAGLFQEWLPGAEVVDGGPALLQARSVKTADELACLVTAAAGAEAGLAAMVAALEPGVTERQLLAVHAATIAGLGLPAPPTEAVAAATPRHGAVARRHLATDRPVAEGELVLLTGAALYAGYEATVGRTWLAGPAPAGDRQTAVAARARHQRDARVAACRPGATGAELSRVVTDPVDPGGPELVAWGVGLGMEPPLIGVGLGGSARLSSGLVLAVQAWAAEEGAGALESDLVLVGPDGPEPLTRFEPCPALVAGGA